MRIIFIFFTVFTFCTAAHSQDVHLTQYYTSNLALNPAYTGNYDGDIKLTANIRSQWGQVQSPIRTNMLSIEKKIHRFPDEIGLGLLLVNDMVTAYYLKTNKVLISGSYQKNIHQNIFRLGIQGGFVFRSIDLNGQSFPDQWNYQMGEFDKNAASGQASLLNSHTYPSINAGTGWMRRFGKTKVAAGYSIFNLTHPDDNFIPDGRGLPFRHVFNSSVICRLTEKISLIPQAQYMYTAKATDLILGANANTRVTRDISLLGGAAYRRSQINSDALMAIIGGSYKRFQVGFSMDFNVSELSNDARTKTAWEVSLIYITPGSIPGKVTLPCDRY